MATPRSAREGRGLATACYTGIAFTRIAQALWPYYSSIMGACLDPFPLLRNGVWPRETIFEHTLVMASLELHEARLSREDCLASGICGPIITASKDTLSLLILYPWFESLALPTRDKELQGPHHVPT